MSWYSIMVECDRRDVREGKVLRTWAKNNKRLQDEEVKKC